MMERGTVLGLDRANGLAIVGLHQGGIVVPAVWLPPEAPPPRSVCWVDQPPGSATRVLLGVEGKQRLVLHDDFHYVVKPAAIAFHQPLDLDTNWGLQEQTGGATTIATSTNNGSAGASQFDRAGQVQFTTGTTAGQFVSVGKNVLNTDPQWLPTGSFYTQWMTATLCLQTTANTICRTGWGTVSTTMRYGAAAGGQAGLYLEYDSAQSSAWMLTALNGTSVFTAVSSYPATINEWITVDLLLAMPDPTSGGTGWAALYINGSYQTTITGQAALPGPGSLGAPFFGLYPRAAASASAIWDRITTHICSPLRQPFPDGTAI